jgi:hypothetical protein
MVLVPLQVGIIRVEGGGGGERGERRGKSILIVEQGWQLIL